MIEINFRSVESLMKPPVKWGLSVIAFATLSDALVHLGYALIARDVGHSAGALPQYLCVFSFATFLSVFISTILAPAKHWRGAMTVFSVVALVLFRMGYGNLSTSGSMAGMIAAYVALKMYYRHFEAALPKPALGYNPAPKRRA